MSQENDFEQWIQKYHDMIYNVIYRLTANKDDAQDLTQDVFLKAFKKKSTFRGEASPKTWLTRIALNHTYNFLNRNKTSRWNEFSENNFQSKDDEPEKVQLKDEHLKTLSTLEKAVLVARVYQDLPYKDIAISLNTSENSAKVSYHKAIKKLRKVFT